MSDFDFHGTHRDRIRSLVNMKFFPSYVAVFCVAPIIGALFGRKSEINKDEKGTANIQANQMINHNTRIEQALRLVVLNDKTLKLYLDDRVDTLFRDSTVSHEALQSFEDYVRGGIDVLYEELIEGAMTQEIAILRIRDLIAKIDLELGSVNKDKIIQSYRRL